MQTKKNRTVMSRFDLKVFFYQVSKDIKPLARYYRKGFLTFSRVPCLLPARCSSTVGLHLSWTQTGHFSHSTRQVNEEARTDTCISATNNDRVSFVL